MADNSKRLENIRSKYEKVKSDLAIKRHDADNILGELKTKGIKDIEGSRKKLVEIEKELKVFGNKLERLLAKAENLLDSYEE